MGLPEKIAEIEAEMAKTQVNKRTEHHLGKLKAKLAGLRAQLENPKKGGPAMGGGFAVRKSGDSTVVFIGLPSVGKSTLLNALTGAKSKTAAYAFTTLDCIPGMMNYKGAKIQLLDLPGIIAGAKEGRGRGREILAVARSANLVLLIVDVYDPNYFVKLKKELFGIGVRLDQEPPNIYIYKLDKGGLNIVHGVTLTKITDQTITAILNEYDIFNANVMIREDITDDQLIDYLVGTRKYAKSLIVLNKIDAKPDVKFDFGDLDYVKIAANKGIGIEELREKIFEKLNLMQVFTKSRYEEANMQEPLMMQKGSTVEDVCNKLHRDLVKLFKYAQIWGKSAKFPGQRVGLDHIVVDGDIVLINKK